MLSSAMVCAFAPMLPWPTSYAAPRSRVASAVPIWSIDPAHTTIAFSVDATGFPRTDAVFREFDGMIGIDLERPANSKIEFRVRARSIDPGSDLLADLLRGRAFLDSDRYAEIRFASTAVEKVGRRTVEVTGDLTLLGVRRPLVVEVEVRRLQDKPQVHLGLTAKARIDRLAFGMREGYPLISRDVDLVVTSEVVEP